MQPTATVLARHDTLWIIAKPAGLPVHPATAGAASLLDWLAPLDPDLRPAHRLDQATSGLVLCSPDPAARAAISQALAAGAIHKTYLALVHGRTHRKGILRRPLQDARRGRPLPAVTRYTLVHWLERASLLRIRPETGRKHQIRRHLAGVGHPIVGDPRHRATGPLPPGSPDRLWLHAAHLSWPDVGLSWDCPLPVELEAHLTHLRSSSR